MEILQKLLQRIEEYAGSEEYALELERAKERFFNPVGKPNEKVETSETELANFIEWFIFDWRLPDGHNLWSKFLRYKGRELSPIELEVLKQIGHQIYSLFQVQAKNSERSRVKDLISGIQYKAVHNLSSALQKGDYFLGRMMVVEEKFYLTEAFFFLPKAMHKFYAKRIKMVRRNKFSKEEFLEELRGLAMKSSRYPRMRLEEFYR